MNYQAGSWTKPRRVIAKVEWHPGELYPRVGFIVTNMARVGDARADQRLVADEPEGEAHQDRREGRAPRSLHRLPDGRGRYLTAFVR